MIQPPSTGPGSGAQSPRPAFQGDGAWREAAARTGAGIALPGTAPTETALPAAYLQADEFAASRALTWWYRLTTPAPPVGRLATLREREHIRRGRLASIILAVQLLFIELPVIPVVLFAPNHAIVLPWLLGCIAALFAAFVCNRRGQLTLAGLLMVASIEVTVSIKILTVPGGISIFYLPQFDILVQPILIAVALLAPWSAFAVAGCNIAFVIAALSAGPHAPDLAAALHNPAQVGDLFAVPIMTQILTAFFGWIIVRNLLDALKRADQAEQLAALEHMLAQSRRQAEARNRQLEEGMAAIVTTIQHVSNHQPDRRIVLPPEQVLWPLAMQLNLFLDRYQRARGAEMENMQIRAAIDELAQEIYQATQAGRPFRIPSRRNTPLDAVLMALSSRVRDERNA
jgi:hypothetical protein